MSCDDLDDTIDAIANGSHLPSADEAAHLGTCPSCRVQLARAEAIDRLLASREDAVPPPGFTSGVMARIGDEHWKADRVFDIGFNVAIVAGLLLALAGGAGLAWSLGFLNVMIEVEPSALTLGADFTARAREQLQTIAMAAVLLTMALGLWWWVEIDEGF